MVTTTVYDTTDEILRIARSKRIPTLPEVAMRLLEIARQDDPDFSEACRAIRSDPAVCGKILKTVNSALFGMRGTVKTIEQAVPALGISMLRTLILSFHLSSAKGSVSTRRSQEIWRSCLTQAVVAELVAERRKSDGASAFMAALLQDVGVLALLAERADEYEEFVLSVSDLPNTAAAERARFGFSHVDVSLAILDQWNIGAEFSAAVRHHHDRVFTPEIGSKGELATVLRAAHLGAAALSLGDSCSTACEGGALLEWIEFLQRHLGYDDSAIDDLIGEVHERVHEYSIMFNFDIGDPPSDDDVVLEAKNLLQEIAISSQLRFVESKKNRVVASPHDDPAYRDCLSGLYNRRYFEECLEQTVAKWLRQLRPVTLLFLDVDRFKSINDEHGHRAGDQAIQHVASWLNSATRKNDVVVRLGGDEFVVVMQMARPKKDGVVQRIANKVPKLKLKNKVTLPISLSVGCVFHQPEQGSTCDLNGLVDLADQLMYKAKQNDTERIATCEVV